MLLLSTKCCSQYGLLKPSSDLCRRLLAVCSVEEMSEVIAGKVEAIILNLLQTYIKDMSTVNERASDLTLPLSAHLGC